MRQAVAVLLGGLVGLGLVGCEQVTAFVKNMQAPGGYPEDLKGLMAKSVPMVDNRLTYPRLAIALTNTRETREIGIGMADCGHFKVTDWQSATVKQYHEFDVCVTRQDEQQNYNIGNFENVGYMLNPHVQWQVVEKYGGNRSKDYQPMGVHWTEGPQAAQFFVPPAWIDSARTVPQTNMVETFLTYVGIYGTSVDPRVWFYQIDQSS